MMRVTEMIDESFEYIKAPHYVFPAIIFCVGMGLSLTALGTALRGSENSIARPFLLIGGIGLTIWSMTQFYTLSLNRR